MRQHFRSSLSSSFRATHEGIHHPIEAGAVKFLSRLLDGLVVDHEAVLVGGNLRRLALVDPPWFSPELTAMGADYFRSQGLGSIGSVPLRISK